MVEVDDAGLVWLKSSASNGVGSDACLEVADGGDRMFVRCSLDSATVTLNCSKASWDAFVEQVRRFC